jgi:hypothetical protein
LRRETAGPVEDVSLEFLEWSDGRHFLQLDVGTLHLSVVTRPSLPTEFATFLACTFRSGDDLDPALAPGLWGHAERPVLLLGEAGGVSVRIERDGKYDDRYFFLLGSKRDIEFAPTLEQTVHLVRASAASAADMAT